MKKRILAILFALTLAATMLPAGLAVSAAADENLLKNGSFEIAAEEGSEEVNSGSNAKDWFILRGKIGERVVPEGEGAVTLPDGDACFAVQSQKNGGNQFLYQTLLLEAGKKYTASILYNAISEPTVSCGVSFGATTPAAGHTVSLIGNIGANYHTTNGSWKRASKTFTVPGEPGEMVSSIFSVYTYNNTAASETATAYFDDARLVEAENQETILWSVDGFENYGYPTYVSSNNFINAKFPFEGYGDIYYDDGRKTTGSGFRVADAIKFVQHEDYNNVMRFSTNASGYSYLQFNMNTIDFAGAGVTVGTPLHLSFKARLVDIPNDLDKAATPTFGEYAIRVNSKDGVLEEFVVGTGGTSEPDIIKADGTTVVADGETVYLHYPSLPSGRILDLSLSTANVNEQNKNANEWTQYDLIFPYQDVLQAFTFTTGCKNVYLNQPLPAGYSWELDDMELTLAESSVFQGVGAMATENYLHMQGSGTASYQVTKAYQNADGSGEQYTMANWRRGKESFFNIPYRTTKLDANKNVKAYQKTDTAVGAAYLAADDATGASLVTAVYKIDGDIRKLVGVGVNAAEAGFVAAPEVALSGITAEAGTYEVKTYIWKIGTLAAQGSSTIVKVAAE